MWVNNFGFKVIINEIIAFKRWIKRRQRWIKRRQRTVIAAVKIQSTMPWFLVEINIQNTAALQKSTVLCTITVPSSDALPLTFVAFPPTPFSHQLVNIFSWERNMMCFGIQTFDRPQQKIAPNWCSKNFYVAGWDVTRPRTLLLKVTCEVTFYWIETEGLL